MTYPTTFATLVGGTQPASLLDTMFNVCGNQGNIGCTASGTNAITLTPNTNFFLPAAYTNYQMLTFVAGATSTGAVTVQISGLAFVNLYNANGVQSAAGDIASGGIYTIVFNQALNAGAGGFIVINAPTPANIPSPQGYLTPVSGSPNTGGDVVLSAGLPFFYTPAYGNECPIFNGTVFIATSFVELQCIMNNAHLANQIYDVFAFNNAGTITIGTGPSWGAGGGNVTPGSAARGTGAGSTQLVRQNGYLVNAVQITVRNGGNTFVVPLLQGTYLGSLWMDSSNGVVSFIHSYGQSRKWGLWNMYNRLPIILKAGDPTASWNYTTNVVRNSNGSNLNVASSFTGLAEEMIDATFIQKGIMSITTQNAINGQMQNGIGFNSSTVISGYTTVMTYNTTLSGAITQTSTYEQVLHSRFVQPPIAGPNNFFALENSPNAVNTTNTFSGTESSMLLTVSYRG